MGPRMTLNESVSHEDRQKGVTTVEYAVMLVLVALAIALAAPSIKTAILATFNAVSSVLSLS